MPLARAVRAVSAVAAFVLVCEASAQAALLAHWQLDEAVAGPVVNEVGPDGTNNGAAINQPGRVGTSYAFDGAGGRVNTNLKSVVPATGEFGIFAWVNTIKAASATGQYLLNNYVAGDPGRSALQVLDGESSWFIESDVRKSGVTVNDGVWHHVGVTRDAADGFDLWVDGTPHSIGSYSTAIGSGSRDWLMGDRVAGGRGFEGMMDDVRVYDRALTASQVIGLPGAPGAIAHWELDESTPGPVADSADGFDGTNHGASVNQPGRIGRAYRFDGGADKVNANTNDIIPANDDFSVTMWVNTDEPDRDTGQYLFSNYEAGVSGRSALQIVEGELSWFVNGNARSAGGQINDGFWHHVGVTRSAGDFTLWVDGEGFPIASDPDDKAIGSGTHDWLMGGRQADELRNYVGLMDDVRVYYHALSRDEMRQVALVPEPASLSLLVLGAGAATTLRQRRRR